MYFASKYSNNMNSDQADQGFYYLFHDYSSQSAFESIQQTLKIEGIFRTEKILSGQGLINSKLAYE